MILIARIFLGYTFFTRAIAREVLPLNPLSTPSDKYTDSLSSFMPFHAAVYLVLVLFCTTHLIMIFCSLPLTDIPYPRLVVGSSFANTTFSFLMGVKVTLILNAYDPDFSNLKKKKKKKKKKK